MCEAIQIDEHILALHFLVLERLRYVVLEFGQYLNVEAFVVGQLNKVLLRIHIIMKQLITRTFERVMHRTINTSRTSLVVVLCREYTVDAYSIPFNTNAVSIPVFLVPNGGFITIVSNSAILVHE